MTAWLDEDAVARAADRLVAALRRRGCAAGDRVAVFAGNGAAFVAARDAATRLGLVLAPINPRLAPPEIAWILGHARPRAILVEATRRAELAVLVRDPDTLLVVEVTTSGWQAGASPPVPESVGVSLSAAQIGATLLYTSGTKGTPKGCVRSAEQEAARARELVASYGLGAGDVHLIACPLAHSAPGIFLRAGRAVGARTAIMDRFTADGFVAAVEAHRATVCFLVPTQLERLLALAPEVRAAGSLASLRAVIVAGAPCSPRLKERVLDWLGEGRLWELYGSSETGTITVLPPGEQRARPGSVGQPVPGVSLRLLDEAGAAVSPGATGEIYVSAPTVMAGYLDQGSDVVSRPGERDGHISVGDLGHLDGDGFLHLVDRKHDTIISGGMNVYPAEVERALSAHPDLGGAVVVGVADEDWGQVVAAVVAPIPGRPLAAIADDRATLVGALRAFLHGRIADYKHPRVARAVPIDELPIGASGKPQRRHARALLDRDG